jgi:glycosyltransferase involved in cell wall biosynthesis
VKRPIAVFGLPLYNETTHLPEALESLLGQSRSDLAIVVADDSTKTSPGAIVKRYAERDPRITYHRNPERLGMVGNWRRAFELARERFPDAPYFAWASDHDMWHPHWLAATLDAIESDPALVAAYPLVTDILPERGERRDKANPAADTAGMSDRTVRLRHVCLNLSMGNAVYALFRAAAVARAGVFRPVLLPDRLLLSEMSLYGQFKQVPEYLWLRRRTGRFSMSRQREMLFNEQRPLYVGLPWTVVHTAVLLNELVWSGRGRPEIGRAEGLRLAGLYLYCSLVRAVKRTDRLTRARFKQTRYESRKWLGQRARPLLQRQPLVVARRKERSP